MCSTSRRPDVIRHISQLHCISMNNTCIRTTTKKRLHMIITRYIYLLSCVCVCVNHSAQAHKHTHTQMRTLGRVLQRQSSFPRTCEIVNQTNPKGMHKLVLIVRIRRMERSRGNVCDTLRQTGCFPAPPSMPPNSLQRVYHNHTFTILLFEWFRIHFCVKFGSRLGELWWCESRRVEHVYYDKRMQS